MKLLVTFPRGFCAGVCRAIEIVDLVLKQYPSPIYVRKEIVHNKMVVEDFKRRGVIFVDDLDQVPDGSCVIFSAHGVAPGVIREAKKRHLKTIDATCPLVKKVHLEVQRFVKEGTSIILIGHKKHDEVIGTMGQAPGKIHLVENRDQVKNLALENEQKIMVLTQTTLSADETRGIFNTIKDRFPAAERPPKDDICYATQNRQDAVKDLLKRGVRLLLVVGSKNSSNSRRLCEVAEERGVKAHLIDQASEIDPKWLTGIEVVGLTAGASAPEFLVQEVINYLKAEFHAESEEIFLRDENVSFSLPRELTCTK